MTSRSLPPLLLLASLLIPVSANAQSENDKATARALGQQGEKALANKDWARAEDLFHRADALFHAPTLLLGLARAQAHEGKFVAAGENYHRIIVDNLTSPPVFAKALQDAKSELPAVEAQRAQLTISVTGADAPQVSVNDVPVNVAALGVQRFVDPGHVVVTSTASGFKTETRTIDLAPGGTSTVTIDMTKDAPVPVAASATAVPRPTDAASTSKGSFWKPATYASFAVGGAGLLMGAITGGIAIGKHSDLKTQCPTGSCDTVASQSTLSSYQTLGALSTAGFVIGIAGAGGGVALLLLSPKSDGAPPPKAATTVRPYFGLGSIGATGAF